MLPPVSARRSSASSTTPSEAIRFVAVATVFAQEDRPSRCRRSCKALVAEESVRVKNRIAEGLAARGWPVPEDAADAAPSALPAVRARRRRPVRTLIAARTARHAARPARCPLSGALWRPRPAGTATRSVLTLPGK